MDKRTFLEELKKALEKEVSAKVIDDSIKYYNQYFESERQNGKSENEVILEIGDPRLIAKTIISTESIKSNVRSNQNSTDYDNEYYDDTEEGKKEFNIFKKSNIQKWYRRLIILLVVVLVFVIIVNLVRWLLPIVIPIALIIWLISTIRKGRK